MQTLLSAPPHLPHAIQVGTHTLRRSFVVNLDHGLHARPCALLIKTLKPFSSEVTVEANGEQTSGRSIMGLLALGAVFGSTVTFTITGEDAGEAMAAINRLFGGGFAEAYNSRARPERTKTL